MKLEAFLTEQETRIAKEIKQLDIYKKLLRMMPDLTIDKDRWGEGRLCSKDVNARATDVVIKHSCGCCADSSLEAWPYAIIEGEKVFSQPPSFIVGEGAWEGGEIPRGDWAQQLTEAGISEVVVGKIRDYFAEHPAGNSDAGGESDPGAITAIGAATRGRGAK